MRGLRYLVSALTVAGALALLPGTVSANTSSFSASLSRYSGQDDSTLACGTMTQAFGFNGEAYSYDQYRQWAWGSWSPAVTFPAGAIVLAASVWGSAAEGGPWVAPGSGVGLSVIAGQTAAQQGNGAGNCNFGYGAGAYGGITVPGNTSSVPFSFDAYAVAQTYATSGTGPWWDYGAYDVALGAWNNFNEIWMVPTSALAMSVQYAFEPSGISAGQVYSGNGTQVVLSWSPNGNAGGTTYTLQRQVVNSSGPQGWLTLYTGSSTSFQTSDQGCGVGYVYRVAVIGAHAQTPWNQTPEWDEYPCSVNASVPAGVTNYVNLSWPEVTAATGYSIVWCQSNSCSQQRFQVGPGVTAAQLTGIQPNTEYTIWACAVTNAWGCPVAASWTYAAVPALSPNNNIGGLAYDQQPLTWSGNGNPAGTRYQLQQGSYAQDGSWQGGMVVDDGTGTSFTANQRAGRSYSYNVWAISAGYGSGTAPSNGVQTQVASTPTLTVTGQTTASVAWPVVAYMTSTAVACQEPAGGAWVSIGTATGGVTSMAVTGLRPNTQYYCATYAVAGNQGIQWWQGTGSPYTSAAEPTAGSDTATQTTLTATWGSGGNPAGTEYQVVLDEHGTNWAQSGTTTGTSYTFAGVAAGEPAWVYVQAVGVGASPTAQGVTPVPPDSAWITNPTVTAVPMAPTITGADGGLGWSRAAGRGYVTLSWPASTGATGYMLYVWDGAAYEQFDLGAATAWDSRMAAIYPTDQSLYPNVTMGSKAPPVLAHNGGGLGLRDQPLDLYCTTGTYYCSTSPSQNYWFTVAAYNGAGTSAAYEVPGNSAQSYYQPTLPLQTDPNPPSVTAWSVNGGGAYTYNSTVAYSLTATQGTSGIAAYAVSNDGSTWTSMGSGGCTVGQAPACQSSVTGTGNWTLLPGPGSKTVWVKVESAAGVWSAPLATAVYVNVDQTTPTLNVVLNGGAATTASTSVTVGVTVTDPVAQSGVTWQARYSTDGGQSWSAWQSEGGGTSWSAPWSLPGGAPGQRTVLVQAENSDQNLGQGGATIYYAAPGTGSGAGNVSSTAPSACTWPVNGTNVSAMCVTQPQVNLTLAPPASAVQMRVSFDGGTWGQWAPAAPHMPVNLGSAPGLKTVWVQYQDAQGTASAATTLNPGYFVLDPGPPTLQAAWVGNASATDSAGHATLQLQGADPIGRPAQMTVTVTDNGAQLYSGAFANQVPLTLPGTGYQMVQVTLTDIAGMSVSQEVGIYVE